MGIAKTDCISLIMRCFELNTVKFCKGVLVYNTTSKTPVGKSHEHWRSCANSTKILQSLANTTLPAWSERVASEHSPLLEVDTSS